MSEVEENDSFDTAGNARPWSRGESLVRVADNTTIIGHRQKLVSLRMRIRDYEHRLQEATGNMQPQVVSRVKYQVSTLSILMHAYCFPHASPCCHGRLVGGPSSRGQTGDHSPSSIVCRLALWPQNPNLKSPKFHHHFSTEEYEFYLRLKIINLPIQYSENVIPHGFPGIPTFQVNHWCSSPLSMEFLEMAQL